MAVAAGRKVLSLSANFVSQDVNSNHHCVICNGLEGTWLKATVSMRKVMKSLARAQCKALTSVHSKTRTLADLANVGARY